MKDQKPRPETAPPWIRTGNMKDEGEFVLHIARRDETGRWQIERTGAFDSPEQALAAARQLVDDYLDAAVHSGERAEFLYRRYCQQGGPDPFVRIEVRGIWLQALGFDAWEHARARCAELCGNSVPAAIGLSAFKGRYDQYDRGRLAAHNLLRRRVRLLRDYDGLAVLPAGSEGRIDMPYYMGGAFDCSVELPVTFQVADERGEVTVGIAYELLEFA